MSELERLQSMFAQGLQAGTPLRAGQGELTAGNDNDPAGFEERFEVYRNNAWQFFQAALERTFPVLQRRVGPEFFRQLAREYREAHPSRNGDLHWVGEQFPAWLVGRLGGSGYEWLSDLARLEWACEDATVACSAAPADLAGLAQYAPEELPALRLQWQASLRRVPSTFPIFSVWHANQGDAEPESVDLSQGAEHCVVACTLDQVVVYRLEPVDFDLLGALMDGQSLGAAIDSTATDPDQLARFLAWAFGEGLVTGVSLPWGRSAPARR
jgi:hypothetical protein